MTNDRYQRLLDEYDALISHALAISDRLVGRRVENKTFSDASYSKDWVLKVDTGKFADAAICVFSPNTVTTPELTSLEYIGAFSYDAA